MQAVGNRCSLETEVALSESEEEYTLVVCDECGYQWPDDTEPVHREDCSNAEEGNFFGVENGEDEDASEDE